MATVNDILEFFEEFAPVSTAMEFDNVGLLVGDKNQFVRRALVSLDITPEVVYEAEKLECELIISHHPVIFQPLKRLEAGTAPYLLAKKGISAICMHTNLDLSESFGVNLCLASAVGIKNVQRSDKGECLFVGELEREMNSDELAEQVKFALDCKGLRYTTANNRIKKVAVCSGSGGSEIFAAYEEGCAALVTGEIKHHEINTANDLGVTVIDAGHFKSENVVIMPLVNKLGKRFSDIIFTKSKNYDDNIKFC